LTQLPKLSTADARGDDKWKLIAGSAQNWDDGPGGLLDKIILKMALTEDAAFRGIR
jgi:hypothetical protein